MAMNYILQKAQNIIPIINHSRNQLRSRLTRFKNSAHCLYVTHDVYPELFSLAFPKIVERAPNGWKVKGKNQKYIWFPPNALADGDIKAILDWSQRFKDYVLIGLNNHLKSKQFKDELDFCMALSFNIKEINKDGVERTELGRIEYLLKYYEHSLRKEEKYLYSKILAGKAFQAFQDFPFPDKENIVVSAIPANEAGKRKLAWRFARFLAEENRYPFLQATLHCSKRTLKHLSVDEKFREWQRIYTSEDCVDLSFDVAGKTILIVDDLYQSGITMWSYAKYLKERGAKHVFGFSIVKSWRDSHNH